MPELGQKIMVSRARGARAARVSLHYIQRAVLGLTWQTYAEKKVACGVVKYTEFATIVRYS